MKDTQSKNEKSRPPVVVVMGHVDHGKTSLLDYIRKTNVAAREAGGITQSIGAYEIIHGGKKITFVDTPGHEAFTAMRSRGAEVADLAILVVAADEGVKPQTKEAIGILINSKTPFVVAVNKIDKTAGDAEKAKNDLTAAGVFLEGYGGQVSWHGISAKTGEGVGELLDLVLLSAEVEHLTFNPRAIASGFVLETRVDRRRGTEAAVILKDGVLKRGYEIRTPSASGKIKILENFLGEQAETLEPSAPALIIGFESLPGIGESFTSAPSLPESPGTPAALQKETAPAAQKQEGKQILNLILKASDAGSLEALSLIIKSLGSDKRPLNVLGESVGEVTDSDAKLAVTSGASIIGFRSKIDKGAKNLIEAHAVRVITSEVIYDLVKAVEEFLASLGKPLAAGELEVLAVFNQAKLEKQLVGGRVVEGVLRNKAAFEILRSTDGGEPKAVGSGRILSMRDKKADIQEAQKGKEAGLLVNAPIAVQAGDHLAVRK